jgi:hypothetical protein
MVKVGTAKGSTIYSDNSVYYSDKWGLPWFKSRIAIGRLTWPVMVNGTLFYVDPKNAGLIPYEHEWQSVDPVLWNLANEDQTISLIKQDFKDKWMTQQKGSGLGGLPLGAGGQTIVNPYEQTKSPVIPRTDPRGTPNEQKANKTKKTVVIVIVVLALSFLAWKLFKKK